MEKCFLCNSKEASVIHVGVRDNPNINVLRCNTCGLVRLDSFIINSDDYYQNAKMRENDNESDFKEIRTAAEVDDKRRFEFIKRMIENRNYLDFGCGAGGVLSMARQTAKNLCGIELENAMYKRLNEEGILCFHSLENAKEELKIKLDVISLFHVLEHIENPITYLVELSEMLSDEGVMVIEVPNADDALLSLYGCESFSDFTYWESHLYLYNNVTFRMLIEKAGLKIRFISQIQRYSLSNTMYWLAKGKPGGHKEWSMLSNKQLDAEYENALARLGIADTIIAVIEK